MATALIGALATALVRMLGRSSVQYARRRLPLPAPTPAASSAVRTPSIGWLVVSEGLEVGRMYPITERGLTIGRAPENDIVAPNALISRRHATIRWDGTRCFLEDLGTRNGTVLNGEAVSAAHPLKNGDEIAVTGLALRFQATDETQSLRVDPRLMPRR
ncbi:MAG: FHA domain-containing protein [Chloroflexi bacterium]|nr:FHA domain-containing protein [Chloroflexota bacterium]